MTFVAFETSGQLRYIDGFKYCCCQDWWIVLPSIKGHSANYDDIAILEPDGRLTIKKGFGCDGASGPTIDTKSAIRGPFVHDALYAMLRKGLISDCRRFADEVLRDLCIYDGMWKWRAWAWFWAVRKFANGSAKRQERKEILAP